MKQPEIFESVFHKYYASLCYFANKFVRDNEAARDIVQEVFLRFWESKGKFENQSALKSFLYNCVQNAALNYLEKLQVRAKANRRLGLKAPDEEDVFVFRWKRMFSRKSLLLLMNYQLNVSVFSR